LRRESALGGYVDDEHDLALEFGEGGFFSGDAADWDALDAHGGYCKGFWLLMGERVLVRGFPPLWRSLR
jgi:hypothetical protein